mmetsp:Transcript_8635/g.24356  ORF Transcript_8635/g.24356 Transcript_8635/m.24356 type:complete len:688 (-) Transcript_8635:305-2368(-)|eukprot:CAMPEP_0119152488 /NCGR_PEP_ID=MMETSP1310-20130426/47881_1 /TAXON_ID=464262 /ORGANISM="Genus nov. species nov., Strain RCC2339" /LENGTH=687 /DNA_ID=CAMNT_0007144855 /DNA_START=116 /DNA_END=2179 /DNA_ORIENTATION=-
MTKSAWWEFSGKRENADLYEVFGLGEKPTAAVTLWQTFPPLLTALLALLAVSLSLCCWFISYDPLYRFVASFATTLRHLYAGGMGNVCGCLWCESNEVTQEKEALLAAPRRRTAAEAGASRAITLSQTDVTVLAEAVSISLKHVNGVTLDRKSKSFLPAVFIPDGNASPLLPLRNLLAPLKPKRELAIEAIAEIAVGIGHRSVNDITRMDRKLSYDVVLCGTKRSVRVVDWRFVKEGSGAGSSSAGEAGEIWKAKSKSGTAGTCLRLVDGSARSEHLMNVYSLAVGRHHLIRTAVIDSPLRAAQLREVILAITQQHRARLRVKSLSLVSTSKVVAAEKDMTVRQHKAVLDLTDDRMEVIHLNFQTNVTDVGGVKFGESQSRKLNEEGLHSYANWLRCDIAAKLQHEKCKPLEKITAYLRNPSDLRSLQAAVHSLRSDLYDALMEKGHISEAQTLLMMDVLLMSVVGKQSLPRLGELFLLAGIDVGLGVLSVQNCKSGLDRTSLCNALSVAVVTVMESGAFPLPAVAHALIHFAAVADCIDEHATDAARFEDVVRNPEQMGVRGVVTTDAVRIVLELKRALFANLMMVGWKVVVCSTGMPGFKFGRQGTILQNPHVIGALPPFIECNGSAVSREAFWRDLTGLSLWRGGFKVRTSKDRVQELRTTALKRSGGLNGGKESKGKKKKTKK